jgi:glycosyltransferase involved in cell wall biosynthesis
VTAIDGDAPADPAVTVAVCTRDRADQLPTCLASLAALHAPAGSFEVLVVDNGSTDGTLDVLRRWCDGGEHRRWVTEDQPGLSLARNVALELAAGEVVLFLDDDAVASSKWASSLAAAFREHPEAAAAGGPVVLELPSPAPPWATLAMQHWWSATDYGEVARRYPDGVGPYGTNMAVRRDVARAAGGFPTRFGRRGRNLLSGEETELWTALRAAGGDLWYEPRAGVRHCVLDDRVSRRWIVRRAWAQGRTEVLHQRSGTTPSDGSTARQVGRHVSEAWRWGRSTVGFWRDRDGDQGRTVDALARAVVHTSAALASCTTRR